MEESHTTLSSIPSNAADPEFESALRGFADAVLVSPNAQTTIEAFCAQLQMLFDARVEQQTQALRADVAERDRVVKVQQALFKIAQLTASPISLDAFYAALHGIVAELLIARNFFIALIDDTGEGLFFPYQVDESGDVYQPRRLRRGLSEYLLRSGQPLLLHGDDIRRLHTSGEIELIGTASECWLGVPLRAGERVVGVLVVQSYTPGVTYTESDQALLSFVSVNIAGALERRQAQDALHRSHAELQATLDQLRAAQRDLVEAEKMAALGQLVAGVAHEVNTPLGISITAITALQHRVSEFRTDLCAQRLTRTGLDEFCGFADQAAGLIARNLQRSAELVRTFKQVAVDRSTDDRRRFLLDEFIAELLPSLRLLWKHQATSLEVDCPEGIELDSYPGALGQVLTNFVQNALIHAFADRNNGRMQLRAQRDGERVLIQFKDDGVGMSAEHLTRIFEPFYTTRRGQGCTGLGLNIVFNLVTEKLGGRIRVESAPNVGTTFIVELPLRLKRVSG